MKRRIPVDGIIKEEEYGAMKKARRLAGGLNSADIFAMSGESLVPPTGFEPVLPP